jgi:cyclopropane fatty-acyl-phospholipid synthase-like methyltransferase
MITAEYKKQLQELQRLEKFSSGLVKYLDVKNFVELHQPSSLLDYGCSQGSLIKQLKIDFPNIDIDGFDPAVPAFEVIKKQSYDCIISNDVIEHIEPEFLDQTLEQMQQLFKNYAWFIIACYPAKKLLPDGRNAHLIIESPNWWLDKIKDSFNKSTLVRHEVVELALGKPELRIMLKKNV